MEALFFILSDEEVNRFLPWYPVKNLEETKKFYKERYISKYTQPQGYAYAICLKENDFPIGYINVDMEEVHDLGYGLRKEFWHRGIVTEAAKAIIEQVQKDGLTYITATHDKNNPRSGNVMKKVGMKYCYSYEEQWQPKDFPVIFRILICEFWSPLFLKLKSPIFKRKRRFYAPLAKSFLLILQINGIASDM